MRFLRGGVATAMATAAVAVAVSAPSPAAEAGHLPLFFNFGITPSKLPPKNPAPVTMSLSWKGGTDDGSHPPALRKLTLEGDRRIVFDGKGVPVCKGGPHFDVRPSDIPKRCRKAAVGHGNLTVEVEFPNQELISVSGRLTLYNLGRKQGSIDLLARTFLVAPVTAEIVFKIEVRRINKERYGWRASAALPKIAGGYGSITDYSLRIGRRLLAATCTDGKLTLRSLSAFADGSKRRETVVRTCSSTD